VRLEHVKYHEDKNFLKTVGRFSKDIDKLLKFGYPGNRLPRVGPRFAEGEAQHDDETSSG
jgi:hypothetical protein